jgi:hypothetical protein
LFASLIAAMILPFSSLNVADASTFEEIEEAEAKIEEFKQKALKDNKIPTSEILEKVGDHWLAKYEDAEHFEKSENAIKGFINKHIDSDGWNGENTLNHLKIQNFETITGSVGSGHEITLLVAEQEKLQGQYEPSEPVRKYHEWIATQYEIPETKVEIREKMVVILGSEEYLDLAKDLANSFNELADNGSVPNELVISDASYWIFVANVANCETISECNADDLRNGQTPPSEEEIEEIQRRENSVPISTGIWKYILPEAMASWEKVYVSYDLYGYLFATSCWYNNCAEEWHDRNNVRSGAIDIDSYTGDDGNLEHAYRHALMYFYGSACDTYSGSEAVINKVTTTPYLAQELRPEHQKSSINVNACATTAKYVTATHDWILGIKVESPGSYYWD